MPEDFNKFKEAWFRGVYDKYFPELYFYLRSFTSLPFVTIDPSGIKASLFGMDYGIGISKGSVVDIRGEGDGTVFRLEPKNCMLKIAID